MVRSLPTRDAARALPNHHRAAMLLVRAHAEGEPDGPTSPRHGENDVSGKPVPASGRLADARLRRSRRRALRGISDDNYLAAERSGYTA